MPLNHIYHKKINGKGRENFVLIHNAGGNHQMFSHQMDTLLKHGHVILFDLPGNGTSQARKSHTITEASQIIDDLCQYYELNDICIIGLNNGGDIAINTVHHHALPIKKMILIDPILFLQPSFIQEIADFSQQLQSPDLIYKKFIDSLVNSNFIQTDAATKQIPIDSFMQANKKTLQDMFDTLIEWDQHAFKWVSAINIPTLCILTNEHHCDFSRLKHAAPQLTIGKAIGSKSWPTLEVPEQVNAMIERFISLPIE